MSRALYRKYRSKKLEDVVGQEHITNLLKTAIERDRIAHAYLFTGPRGVGKTSVARILAHAAADLPYEDEREHLDIIEIDAASNNGVDDVRTLREKAMIAPAVAKRKVYIIDEVHMLSKAAFNALLKTLEEPPHYIVFILATTDADKLPATIISRTQIFNFRPISEQAVISHLQRIANDEGITIDEESLRIIARRGQGSFRDSIGLLDQLSSLETKNGITASLVESFLGLMPSEAVESLIDAYLSGNLKLIVNLLDQSEQEGYPPVLLSDQLIEAVRRKVAATPEVIPLMDRLLEVSRSSQPAIKLLTALTIGLEKTKHKSVAVSIKDEAVSATPAELRRQRPGKSSEVPAGPEPATVTTIDPDSFDWNELLETTKRQSVALFSVLKRSAFRLNERELIIYAGSNFYKRKLDDSRMRRALDNGLREVGLSGIQLTVSASGAPINDSQIARVAAMMGGGEEVNLEKLRSDHA